MNSAAITAATGQSTVGRLLAEQARIRPEAIAVEDERRSLSYAAFNTRVNRLANALAIRGVGHGDRVAILAENRVEYVELEFACAKLGAIVAALNWRLARGELEHCVALAAPKLAIVSPRHARALYELESRPPEIIETGDAYEGMLAAASETEPAAVAVPEDGLVILYTSGTTGRPKGAVVSHRAFIARVTVFCVDYGLSLKALRKLSHGARVRVIYYAASKHIIRIEEIAPR